MSYITRDDGERFVIPSYRDTLRALKSSLLKREIVLLASNYGNYATLQKKGKDEFEIAFSPDSGYLLGETVWDYFNRPRDLIYCEAIPNTTDAILVIVKGGSVYLDGSFPIDSISEELVIFKTQQNEFDVHIYGDVPISKKPEENKFSFDATSIHSFTVLDAPIFQKLPILKIFQLQPIDIVLKRQGIGAFPIKPVLIGGIFIVIAWMTWGIWTPKTENIIPQSITGFVNPYQSYMATLSSPNPVEQVQTMVNQIIQLTSMTGWYANSIDYSGNALVATVKSRGGLVNTLYGWARKNHAVVNVESKGIYVTLNASLNNRQPPNEIHETSEVVARLIDRLLYVLPKDSLVMQASENKGQYKTTILQLTFSNISLTTLSIIGNRLSDLPLVLSNAKMDINNNLLSGSLTLIVLGR
jgi:hypothetical protein